MKAILCILTLVTCCTLFASPPERDQAVERLYQPRVVFFGDDNTTDPARALIAGAIKSFIEAATHANREKARDYLSQNFYKTAQADRTQLAESFLKLLEDKGAKAQWVLVLPLRQIEWNGAAAFSTTLVILEAQPERSNNISAAPREMIWFVGAGKPQGIVSSDFDITVKARLTE